jgi:hypothetical protein
MAHVLVAHGTGYCVSEATFCSREKRNAGGSRMRTVTSYLPSCFISYGVNVVTNLTVDGTAVAQWLRCCATNRKVAGSIPGCLAAFFIYTKSFRSHYGPGVD